MKKFARNDERAYAQGVMELLFNVLGNADVWIKALAGLSGALIALGINAVVRGSRGN